MGDGSVVVTETQLISRFEIPFLRYELRAEGNGFTEVCDRLIELTFFREADASIVVAVR